MKIILFVNDSYFAYLLAKPTIDRYHEHIEMVVYSSKIKGSTSKVLGVLKKTHWRYFCYRCLVDLISRFNVFYNKKAVSSLVKKYHLKAVTEQDVNNSPNLKRLLPSDLGLAFNFDQILRGALLRSFKHGILNLHASKLPRDKGISPVLWAFARGDQTIWASIYQMGEKLDTGLVYKQFMVPINQEITAFSLYEKICFKGGYELASAIDQLIDGQLPPILESKETDGNYWGWPDETHKKFMSASGRKFINLKDILNSTKIKNSHLHIEKNVGCHEE